MTAPKDGSFPPLPDGLVEMGHLSGLHGVQGAFKVFSHTRPRDNICSYRQWWLGCAGATAWEPREVRSARAQGPRIVATLEGVSDRDSAAALVGARIAVARSALPPPAPGEYYWADLIGLSVVTPDGEPLGTVRELFELPANDVLVVAHAGGERLIPFVTGATVREVDLDAGRLVADWDPSD
mgnify:CR=1 FL=1